MRPRRSLVAVGGGNNPVLFGTIQQAVDRLTVRNVFNLKLRIKMRFTISHIFICWQSMLLDNYHSKAKIGLSFVTLIRGRFHKSWPHGANIEIALLKLGARRKARSTPVKSFSKFRRKAQIGRKTVNEIDPSWEQCYGPENGKNLQNRNLRFTNNFVR